MLDKRELDYESYIEGLKPEMYRTVDLAWARRFKTFFGFNQPDVPRTRIACMASRKPMARLKKGGVWSNYHLGLSTSLEVQIDRMYKELEGIDELHLDEDISVVKNCLAQVANNLDVSSFVHLHGCLGRKSAFLPLTADKIMVWDERQRQKLIGWGLEPYKVLVEGYEPRYGKYQLTGQASIDMRHKVLKDLGIDWFQKVVLFAPYTLDNFGDGGEDTIRSTHGFLAYALDELLIGNNDISVIVKLHPSASSKADVAYWTKWAANHRRIKVVHKYNSFHLAIAANCLLVHHSTYAIDGYALKRPTIIVEDGMISGVEEYGDEFVKVSDWSSALEALIKVLK